MKRIIVFSAILALATFSLFRAFKPTETLAVQLAPGQGGSVPKNEPLQPIPSNTAPNISHNIDANDSLSPDLQQSEEDDSSYNTAKSTNDQDNEPSSSKNSETLNRKATTTIALIIILAGIAVALLVTFLNRKP